MYERIPNTNKEKFSFAVEGRDPNVTKIVDRHDALPKDEATYTVTVRNPTTGDRLVDGYIEDILPKEFEYLSTLRVDTLGGSIRNGALLAAKTEKLPTGETKIIWDGFTVPAGGSVSIQFKIKVNEHVACRPTPFHNSAFFYYTIGNSGQKSMRFYRGELPGLVQEDLTVICTQIHAKEDSKIVTIDAATNALDVTSVAVFGNDTLDNAPLDISKITATEVSAEEFLTTNTDGKKILKENIFKKFENILDDPNDEISLDLFGKNFDAQTGNFSWSEYAFAGKYLLAYKICEIKNNLNCSVAPVLVTIAREPQATTIEAVDDLVEQTRRETDALARVTISVFENDTYALPQNPGTHLKPDKNSVKIALTAPTNPDLYGLEEVDIENNGDRIIQKITGKSPLAGSYLTENGNFIIPGGMILEGVYTLPYEICTKIKNSQIKNTCATANIIFEMKVTPVAKPGWIRANDDVISTTHLHQKPTPESLVNILTNDRYATPDNLSDQKIATPEATTFALRLVPNFKPELQYSIDVTKKTIQAQENGVTVNRNVIATIVGVHPLAGAYLTDK